MTRTEVESFENEDDTQWLLSRKAFVRSLFLSGLAAQLPWLTACSSEPELVNTSPLNRKQFQALRDLQRVLFPDDGNGPGASQIGADKYFIWVLNDSLIDPKDSVFFVENLDKFNRLCENKYVDEFTALSSGDQYDFVNQIAKEQWAKSWLSRMLTLIFEALLLDPAYGSNLDEIGWNWLEHNPGQPRPTKKLLYPEILALHEI